MSPLKWKQIICFTVLLSTAASHATFTSVSCAPPLRAVENKSDTRIQIRPESLTWNEITLPEFEGQRAVDEKRLLAFLSGRANRLFVYESIIQRAFPDYADRSRDEQKDFLTRIKFRANLYLQNADPTFDAIQNQRGKGYYWQNPDLASALVLKLDHIYVHEQEVFWNQRLIPGLTSQAHEKRKLLLFLLRNADRIVSPTQAAVQVWPDASDVPPRTFAEMDALIRSLQRDFLWVDPNFRRIQISPDGYVWFTSDTRADNSRRAILKRLPPWSRFRFRNKTFRVERSTACILLALSEDAPRTKSRDELKNVLSENGFATRDEALYRRITSLRDILSTFFQERNLIATRPSLGYAWIGSDVPELISPPE